MPFETLSGSHDGAAGKGRCASVCVQRAERSNSRQRLFRIPEMCGDLAIEEFIIRNGVAWIDYELTLD
ncbi:hypothetical protein ROP_pROB01-05100 (plasmid) [Rhodococcus opacus B4]|uniref:Uncharacterized protein n=2 Tax=Rhodococcus opacus TaxID=37919 RepID=C1BCF4_RHOOB|nr:hypothetical protein ROP_pROB01-05100 [Rhodococcus opacus B4]